MITAVRQQVAKCSQGSLLMSDAQAGHTGATEAACLSYRTRTVSRAAHGKEQSSSPQSRLELLNLSVRDPDGPEHFHILLLFL